MKKGIMLAIVLGVVFGSCSKSSNPVNSEPSVPSLSYPTDDLLCIDNTLEFRWNASNDADGDAISYQIEISSDQQFGSIIQENEVSQTTRTYTLEKGATFFWRVRAMDNQMNQSAYSEVWSFYTAQEAVVNHLPTVPEVLNPSLGSTISEASIALGWQAFDVDGDPLTFDLYFGTANEPPLLAENLDVLSYDVDLESGNTYYWKIVVTDSHNGSTEGPVWNFSTE